jgi:DNA repair protein RadC
MGSGSYRLTSYWIFEFEKTLQQSPLEVPLLQHFGSVRRVNTADMADIATVRGFGRKTAGAICATLDTPYREPV